MQREERSCPVWGFMIVFIVMAVLMFRRKK